MNEHKSARWSLITLDALAGVAALVGATMALTGWPYRAPLDWLDGTPFRDYLVPGLILGVVVGGSALLATFATIRSAAAGALTSLVAGIAMMGWIAVEWVVVPPVRFDFLDIGRSIQQVTWQQPLYFLVGLAMFVLALRVAPGGWRGLQRAAHLA
jgi:hypothetical protein